MKKPTTHIFNLLQPLKPPESTWDLVYEWLLNKAKIIIMITQILIIITFFAKFVLDTVAKDKDEEIESLQLVLRQLQRQESEINRIQQRAIDYREIWNKSSNKNAIFEEIYTYFPNRNADVSVTITNDRVTVSGEDRTVNLNEIESRMKASETFTNTDVSLSIEQQNFIEDTGIALFNAIIEESSLFREPI